MQNKTVGIVGKRPFKESKTQSMAKLSILKRYYCYITRLNSVLNMQPANT